VSKASTPSSDWSIITSRMKSNRIPALCRSSAFGRGASGCIGIAREVGAFAGLLAAEVLAGGVFGTMLPGITDFTTMLLRGDSPLIASLFFGEMLRGFRGVKPEWVRGLGNVGN
jgi:hypothetical protein